MRKNAEEEVPLRRFDCVRQNIRKIGVSDEITVIRRELIRNTCMI
jgi:hypothetical protein